MAPEVQTYGSPKVEEEALPGVRVQPHADLASFGGGQAAEGAFSAASGVAKEAGELASQEFDRANQVAHLAADNAQAQKQAEIQTNVSKMYGQNSLGASDYVKKEWDKFTQDQAGNASNRVQQMAIQRSAASRSQELNRYTTQHVSQQMEQFADEQFKGGIENATSLAVMNPNDQANVQSQLERANALMIDQANRKGIYKDANGQETDAFKAMKEVTLGQFHKSVIQSMLDKDDPEGVNAAKEYLATHKEEMGGQTYKAARNTFENAETKQLGMDAWDEMKGMRLADGTPDTGKMERQIMADQSLPVARKLQIVQFVKARAGEERVQFYQQVASNDRSFADQVTKARTQGVPMATAMNLAEKFSRDPVDRQQKMAYVQTTYGPPSDSDPDTKVNLRERIEMGQASLADIDTVRGKQLNDQDWMQLRQEYFKAQVEGHTPQMKLVNNQIKELSVQNFGSDRTRSSRFKDAVDAATQGMSPDEKYKTAVDMIKKDPATQHDWPLIGKWGGQAAFEVSSQQSAAHAIAMGQASQDVGHDEVMAIGQGVMHTGAKSYGPADVDKFAQEFGGYEQIKKGTPVNNAIQTIMQSGQVVSPEGVRWVLARSKNGKLPPPTRGQ